MNNSDLHIHLWIQPLIKWPNVFVSYKQYGGNHVYNSLDDGEPQFLEVLERFDFDLRDFDRLGKFESDVIPKNNYVLSKCTIYILLTFLLASIFIE